MTAYLRLLDHLSIHVEPWAFLSDACMEPSLVCLHSLALDVDASDRRSLFHRALLRCRQERCLGAFFQLARTCEPSVEPVLSRFAREVFEQPQESGGFLGRNPDDVGTFELVVDTGTRGLDIGSLDRWVSSLTRDCRLGRLRLLTARCLSVGASEQGVRTVLHLECTASDFLLLWSRVQTGRMARVGPNWINGMGRFHPAPTDGLDEPSEVVQFVINEAPSVTEAVAFRASG